VFLRLRGFSGCVGALSCALAGEADGGVAEAVEGFAAVGGDVGVASFVGFGDGVEERPRGARSEFPMGRFAPLLQDFGDLGGGDGAAVEGPDDEVVGFAVGEVLLLVGVDALIELDEAVPELPHGPAGEVAEVALGEAGVLAAEFDLAGEGEVVADEDLGPGDHGGREGFVVRVSDANDPAVVAVTVAGEFDFEDPEVAGALVAEGVGLATEDESSVAELFLDFGEQVPMRHGIPGLGVGRCRNGEEGFAGDLLGSAVNEESGWAFGDDFCFKEIVHRFVVFS